MKNLLEFDESAALNELSPFIGEVAGEQKPVSGLDLIGEAHEQQRVAGESWENKRKHLRSPLTSQYQAVAQAVALSRTEGHSAADDFWTLLHVTDGGDGQAPVCHRAPEMLE